MKKKTTYKIHRDRVKARRGEIRWTKNYLNTFLCVVVIMIWFFFSMMPFLLVFDLVTFWWQRFYKFRKEISFTWTPRNTNQIWLAAFSCCFSFVCWRLFDLHSSFVWIMCNSIICLSFNSSKRNLLKFSARWENC